MDLTGKLQDHDVAQGETVNKLEEEMNEIAQAIATKEAGKTAKKKARLRLQKWLAETDLEKLAEAKLKLEQKQKAKEEQEEIVHSRTHVPAKKSCLCLSSEGQRSRWGGSMWTP